MTSPDDINALMRASHDIYVRGLRQQLQIADDWAYRRTPYATDEAMQQLYDLIGRENYTVVSGYARNGGQSLSMFVSPEGMKRINDYIANNRGAP